MAEQVGIGALCIFSFVARHSYAAFVLLASYLSKFARKMQKI